MKKKNGKWIQKANIKEGALSKKLGVPENKNIPMDKLKQAEKSKNPKTRKQAVLAITFKKMAKKSKGK
ncbi:hypothetical protein YTPLAS21_19170 [Candidatus Nitrosocosmicus sp.]|nr:hypothetical protein YTPLAS21_19170 [Candidatus Nitrosocosmicus sp.]